uniref:Protein kinase domain-containing protein n=1 Tax=Panagrellus redivivus TaxID=6233 RepID=A0A7E4VBN3_PANRE
MHFFAINSTDTDDIDNAYDISAAQTETFDEAEAILQRLCFTYYPSILLLALVTDIVVAVWTIVKNALIFHFKMIRCNWSYWSTRSTAVTNLCRMSDQSIFVLKWSDAIRQSLNLSGAKKLAEGAYSEVYVATLNTQRVILKVIPFQETDTPSEHYPLVNDEEMASADVILTEVTVSKALSDLSDGARFNRALNFVKLHKTFVFRGNYPKELLAAWNTYDMNEGCRNTCPTEYDSADRHYIVMALGFGGVDLESYVLRSYNKAMSILLQVALALAAAESEFEFEHRDLHWRNILIHEYKVPEFIKYVVDGEDIRVRSHGVMVVIIDFTNSRIKKNSTIVYKDLNQDEFIFLGHGDPQYQVYRDMRTIN